ncbi:MAG TPA: hypothetical protein ENO17_00560 [Candidatus Atribacteria bacterium]|nr:hypothetical protein [Candidatus Atribacteria bacterium]
MEPKNMDKADFITSIFLVIFGLAIFLISIRMPTFRNLGANPYSAPGIVPSMLGAIIFILGMILFFRSIAREGYKINYSLNSIKKIITKKPIQRFLTVLFLSLSYVFLLGKVDYFLLSSGYIFVFILAYELNIKKSIVQQNKTMIFALAEAVLIGGSIALVFRYLFLIRLP